VTTIEIHLLAEDGAPVVERIAYTEPPPDAEDVCVHLDTVPLSAPDAPGK